MSALSDLEKLEKQLADSGKLIEAGWIALRIAAIPADAPQIQLDEMRQAFFAGAQHVFHTMMRVLDPGEEPTANDLRRFELLDKELRGFIGQFAAKHLHTRGSA
jgi:hypothetical protein